MKKIIIYTLKLYNHPAETHRLLKFLFHIMGRLVPAHNDSSVLQSVEGLPLLCFCGALFLHPQSPLS